MSADLYVIEARDAKGRLLSSDYPQPEQVFGLGAIKGISSDAMAKVIFAHRRDVTLAGDSIAIWPTFVNPRWIARRKTW